MQRVLRKAGPSYIYARFFDASLIGDPLLTVLATSPFLNYHPKFAPVPYPAVICTSVNDVALHGIPGDYRLRAGDLLSVDAGATLGETSRYLLPYLVTMTVVAVVIAFVPWIVYLAPYVFGLYTPLS